MTDKNKLYKILFLFILAALFLGVFLLVKKSRPEENFSSKEYENILADNILSQLILPSFGKDYKELKVQEKRNAIYAVLTRLDPVFSLEGADVDYLRKSLDELESAVNGFKSVSRLSDKSALDALQPLEFLKRLPRLERLRKQVIASAKAGEIEDYNNFLAETINQYEKAIDKLADQYRRLEYYDYSDQQNSQKLNYNFVFLNSQSSWSELINSLETLKQSAFEQRQKLEERKKCLVSAVACDELFGGNTGDFLAKILKVEYKIASSSEPNLKAKEIVDGYLELSGEYEKGERIYGLVTACFGQEDLSYFYPARFKESAAEAALGLPPGRFNGIKSFFKPFYLNDLYFIEINNEGEGRFPYFKPLLEAGYNYYNVAETNYYQCPDLSYQARLAAIDKIVNDLAARPLEFKDKELNEKQDKLIGGGIIKESELAEYLDSLADKISTSSENILAAQFGDQEILRAESMIRQFKENSAGFADLAAGGVFFNQVLKRLEEINVDSENKMSLIYLFSTHSYPSLYFLPFNQSFVKQKIEFGQAIAAPDKYIKLDDLPAGYQGQKLLELIKISRHLFQ